MPKTFAIDHPKGTSRLRLAQLRHSTDIDLPLIVPADLAGGTIKLSIISGIGEGPTTVLDTILLAPAPGELDIADIIKDPPLTGAAWPDDPDGANFSYVFDWAMLDEDAYDGLRVYQEVYELDMRAAGFGIETLIYDVTITSNLAPITP